MEIIKKKKKGRPINYNLSITYRARSSGEGAFNSINPALVSLNPKLQLPKFVIVYDKLEIAAGAHAHPIPPVSMPMHYNEFSRCAMHGF